MFEKHVQLHVYHQCQVSKRGTVRDVTLIEKVEYSNHTLSCNYHFINNIYLSPVRESTPSQSYLYKNSYPDPSTLPPSNLSHPVGFRLCTLPPSLRGSSLGISRQLFWHAVAVINKLNFKLHFENFEFTITIWKFWVYDYDNDSSKNDQNNNIYLSSACRCVRLSSRRDPAWSSWAPQGDHRRWPRWWWHQSQLNGICIH